MHPQLGGRGGVCRAALLLPADYRTLPVSTCSARSRCCAAGFCARFGLIPAHARMRHAWQPTRRRMECAAAHACRPVMQHCHMA